MSPWLALLGWGTLVGLDLVSVPQMMIARPIVAGAGAGLLLGDFEMGLRLGILFELFQFDILPVGAVRYPEYGPATIAAVAAGQSAGGALGVGLGAVVGLFTAMVGGASIHWLRRANGRAVQAVTARLEAGSSEALLRVHVASLGRDALRAALVTALGLGLAWVAARSLGGTLTVVGATVLAAAAGGAALAAGASGLLRLVGRGPGLGWFAAGLVAGAGVAWLR
ncbi:MAG: PTS sugar transporter subunit IIC [Gemmatimonadales bacterium]